MGNIKHCFSRLIIWPNIAQKIFQDKPILFYSEECMVKSKLDYSHSFLALIFNSSFKLPYYISTSNSHFQTCNFKLPLRASTANFNFNLQIPTSNLNFELQLQTPNSKCNFTSTSNFDFKLQLQTSTLASTSNFTSTSSCNYSTQLQTSASNLNRKFQL